MMAKKSNVNVISRFSVLLSVLLLFNCDNSTSILENSSGKKDYVNDAKEVSEPSSPTSKNQFNKKVIQLFADSIVSYFNKNAGYNIRSYEVTVDTLKNELYTAFKIVIRTNEFKSNGLISYDIYTFASKKDATTFFNELKTQELISPFGLNKRPNHILLDSNQVFWHHLEHSYGHRVSELTQIFNAKFNFYPKSTNLDSVSGFSYCKCKNENASLEGIKNKFKIAGKLMMWENDSLSAPFASDCFNFISHIKEISIQKNFISFNGKSKPIEVISSIHLPSNQLFWKYYFLKEDEKEFSSEFTKYFEKIKNLDERLSLYEIKLSNHCYISIVKLENGSMFMIIDNDFYSLAKQ